MRKILALLLTFIFALSLVGCGNQTSNGGESQTTGQSDTLSSTDDKSIFDTSWAANDFEALIPELPFTGWTTKQENDSTYEMELIGLNTSAATNPPDSGEADGADKTKLKNYLDSLSAYGFTVEETGTDFKWLAKDTSGNEIEFMCADGGCWITIKKAN